MILQKVQEELASSRDQNLEMRKNYESFKGKYEQLERTNEENLSNLRQVEKERQKFERELMKTESVNEISGQKIEEERRKLGLAQ